MSMGEIASIIALSVMVWLSRRAGRRFPADARIPMQWGLDGKPTWTAPRGIGLWFAPILAVIVLGFVAVVLRQAAPTTEATAAAGPVTVQIVVAASFVGAHFLHLRSVLRRGA